MPNRCGRAEKNMKDGFIKVAACSPKVVLADPKANADAIIAALHRAAAHGVRLAAFPELAMTGYTCGDLFMHELLLDSVETELLRIARETANLRLAAVIGAPIRCADKLYNCAVVISRGVILAVVPKTHMPNYGEFYELRHFAVPSRTELGAAAPYIDSLQTFFNPDGCIFSCTDYPDFRFGIEICEDLWVASPPSDKLAAAGALIIVNCSAGDEIIGKADYRKRITEVQSAKNICAYLYCGAGEGESTSDMVFSGHCFAYENGTLLAEKAPFDYANDMLITEIDLGRLLYDRRRVNSFNSGNAAHSGHSVDFSLGFGSGCPTPRENLPETELTRRFPRNPFVPHDENELNARAKDILTIQALGLKRRLEHTHSMSAVIGISGGLDSALALLAAAKACDLMGIDRKFVHAVTMPCFGTTEHTKQNAVALCNSLGVTLHTIPIADSVRSHFRDIGHDETCHNVVYENAQARMRTLVLMDLANALNGLVVGTGDLSELALGWATYNGDHMSMYGVNAGIPKTLIKYVVRYYARHCENPALHDTLTAILETPISPELLPADEKGNIAQKTEDLVGPYELHDFFLYYVLRWGCPPAKLFRIAKQAFRESEFSNETILKWLKNFYRRFFNQQFKRNCLPDGPKVGSVCLSPRGDWRMPSDAVQRLWADEIQKLS